MPSNARLSEIAEVDIELHGEILPDLVNGIEIMSSNGQKIAWNISDYLASLEKSLAATRHLLDNVPRHQTMS